VCSQTLAFSAQHHHAECTERRGRTETSGSNAGFELLPCTHKHSHDDHPTLDTRLSTHRACAFLLFGRRRRHGRARDGHCVGGEGTRNVVCKRVVVLALVLGITRTRQVNGTWPAWGERGLPSLSVTSWSTVPVAPSPLESVKVCSSMDMVLVLGGGCVWCGNRECSW